MDLRNFVKNRSMPSWFYKYKVYHLFFWSVYHFAWWTLAIGSPFEAFNNILFSPYTTKFLFYVIFQALGVYFNLYYLIPKFLITGKYFTYLASLLTTIFISASFIISGYYLTAYWSPLTFNELFKVDHGAYWHLFKSNSLPSTIASMTLAMSIKLGKNWIEAQKRQQLLEKEKIATELKFLKSQFNPHFLFNTINSIFVLIHKNQDLASESLAKFSELMRYQLYECNEPKIPLEREINYLQNFIELGMLRLESSTKLDVHFDPPTSSKLCIAPFILMPFIENAFKHISQTDSQTNWLKIDLKLKDNSLVLEIANSISPTEKKPNTIAESSGIGLKNVNRRLNLLYPNQHDLLLSETASKYSAILQIDLENYQASKKTTIINNPVTILN